jgi:D-alanine-D-alanine ligase
MSARSVLSVLDPQKYDVTPIGITEQGVWVTGAESTQESARELIQRMWDRQVDGLTRVTLLPEMGQKMLYTVREAQPGDKVQQAAEGHQVLEPIAALDVVFPVLHGTFGEDGTVQGLFELSDLAYVGANVLGSAVGMDKALCKDVLRANGLPVVPSILVSRGEIERDAHAVISCAEALADYPLFTKPANLGSSVGITKCRSRSDLYEGLMEAASYDRRVLVERGVPNAREIEVSVLGNDTAEASIPGEVRPSADFYTYEAKYEDDRSELIIPAALPPAVAENIRELAVKAFKAIDGAGMARVDFLFDPLTEEVFVGEINTIPGFTRISMYPKLWEATGLPYARLVDRLIELAMERKAERDRTERRFRRKR